MATLGSITSRVSLMVRGQMTPEDIQVLINRVYQEELEAYAWSRLKANIGITTVAPISTGTVTAISGSQSVTGSGTAWNANMVGYYIRMSGLTVLSRIIAVTSPTALTIDSPWGTGNITGGAYLMYPLYYEIEAPVQKIIAIKNQLNLRQVTLEQLDFIDPDSYTTGSNPSLLWAPAGRTSEDDFLFALWPIPSTAQIYFVRYLKGYSALVQDGDVPLIAGSVIENKAISDACASIYAQRGDQTFFQMSTEYYRRYGVELEKARAEDAREYGQKEALTDIYSQNQFGIDYISTHDNR